MVDVVWTERSASHLDGIAEFVARNSPSAARSVARRILARETQIAQYPYLGRVVPEINDDTIREVIVRPYRVIYRIRGQRAEVLAVWHGARILQPDDMI